MFVCFLEGVVRLGRLRRGKVWALALDVANLGQSLAPHRIPKLPPKMTTTTLISNPSPPGQVWLKNPRKKEKELKQRQ